MINLTAPINSLGYGVVGHNLLKSLLKINSSTALYPISQPEFQDEYVFRGMENRGKSKLFPSVKIWHQNEVHTHVGKGQHIGFPIFELTEFTNEEKLSMSHCDRLFVCSEWAKNVLLESKGAWERPPVDVVPLGVDTEIFKPHLSTRQKTIFFNCGKWEIRKGHDVLVECFNSAFGHDDDVELWMMCDNPFIGNKNEYWKNLYKSSKLGDKIRIIPRQKSHQDVYQIMKQTDCGIFPARAEGWNLELLEMMACGKRVIATNYSAHTQYCSPVNSLLVNIEKLEPAYDGVFFDGKIGEWASLDIDQYATIIEYMKMIHSLKQSGDLQLNTNGIETAESLSWEESAKTLLHKV